MISEDKLNGRKNRKKGAGVNAYSTGGGKTKDFKRKRGDLLVSPRSRGGGSLKRR